MRTFVVLGFVLVSLAYVLGGEVGVTNELSADKYRQMLNSFESKVKRLYRELHTKSYSDKEFVNNKLEGSMAAVRSKRETESTADLQSQISSALSNMQKMFDDIKSSDGAKGVMDKLNEFGKNLQVAGQDLTGKIQETLKNFQKPAEGTS